MIVGRTESADGGYRRIAIRHTQIVDNSTRLILVDYLKEKIYQKCLELDWVGYRDIFPNLPEDILNTPLKVIYELCCSKFADNPKSIPINLAKYLGMLTREAVYYSEVPFCEKIMGSIRVYSLESKKLKENNSIR